MNIITIFLEQLELSEIESTLYLQLLKTGAVSIRDLAAATGINRSTTYVYIKQLIDKELVIKIVKGSQTQIAAIQPKKMLPYLVDKKAATVKSLQEQLPAVLQTIDETLPKVEQGGEAEIKYYKSTLGVRKIYEEALKTKELRLYVTLSKLAHLVPSDLFETALQQNPELKIYEIYGDSPETIEKFSYRANSNRYFYKFMPPHVGLTSPGILLYDNKVAIINTDVKISCIVLYNSDYYQNSKKLFDFIWELLPQPNE